MKYESYQKISNATKDLRNATKITDRRKAADGLKKLLSDRNIRSKLAQDAIAAAREQKKTSEHSILQKIYSNAIRAGLHAANSSLSSRISKKNEDVMLPFKIFSLVDMDSDAMINAKKKNSASRFYECEPFTFESFDRYRGTNDTLTYISSKDLCDLLAFCLKCLEDDDTRHLAEVDLLNALQKLCSRPDYVTHYHPYHDVLSIMTTVDYTLKYDKSGGMCSALAARAFYNLFHQLIMSLDIDMSLHVETAFSLILDWVRRCSANVGVSRVSDSSQIAKYMFGVASDIMTEHPERCIATLEANNFGLDLFRNARKRWDYSRGEDKHALVMYFSSHIYVCEVAGHLQGMLPGDLGDVGSASIDRLKLEQLKDMLLSENNLEVYVSTIAVTHDESGNSRLFKKASRSNKRRKITSGNDQERFQPLHEPGRKYLELCARVLRSLQRWHVVDMEMKSTDNLSDYILEHDPKVLEEVPESLSKQNMSTWVSQSPFFLHVASKCFGSIVTNKMKESSSMESEIPILPTCLQMPDKPMEYIRNSECLLMLPMLASMLDLNVCEPTDEILIVYLQVIGACAETFPRGECWTSTNVWYQTDYSPIEWNGEDLNLDEVTYCNVCSIQDLAAIVYSLSLLLIRFSSASSNQQVQMWTLICLLKLTDASHIVRRYLGAKRTKDELSAAWRCVWDILLYFEYWYHSTTGQAESCNVGELVLMLLTEIIRGALMNSYQDDLLESQDKVWSIPAFSNPMDLKVSAGLELASFVVHYLGMVEGGSDNICYRSMDPSLQQLFKKESGKGRERHFRLASFCMQCLTQSAAKGDVMLVRRIGPFLSSLCCALMDDAIAKNMTSYTLKADRELKLTSGVFNFHVARKNFLDNKRNIQVSHLLWDDSIHPFSSQYYFEHNWLMWNKLDHRNKSNCPFYSLSDRFWLFNFLENRSVSKPVQSASKTKMDLKDFAINHILQWLHQDHTLPKSDCVSITQRIVGIKIALSISLCGEGALQEKKLSLVPIETSVHSIVEDVINKLHYVSDGGVQHALIEITGIIRFIREHLPLEEGCYLSGILPTKLCGRFYKLCEETIVTLEDLQSINSDDNLSHCNQSTLELSNHHLSADEDSIGSSEDNDMNIIDSKDGSPFSVSLDKTEMLLSNNGTGAKKRKKNLHTSTLSREQGMQLDNELRASYWRHQVQWICVQIMVLIEPSSRTISVIGDRLLWTDMSDIGRRIEAVDPHSHLVFLGILTQYVLNIHILNDVDNQMIETDEESTHTLIIDIILNCREISIHSSPMLLMGFGLCRCLVSSNSSSAQNIDQVLQVLVPDSSLDLRALKNRPALRLLQVLAATKCFMSGSANFHRRFDNIFATQFVLESLQHHKQCIRRAGIEALGSALKLFPEKFQTVIVADALAVFPPKPSISENLFLFHVLSEKRNANDSESFADWVDRRTKLADLPDLKKKGWIDIRVSVETDKIRCISQIARHTTDEAVAQSAILALLVISRSTKRRGVALAALDSIAKTLKFVSLEQMLENYQAHFFYSWSMMNVSFLSMPIVFSSTLASRNLLRLLDCPLASICEQALVESAAMTYINKSVHSILPELLLSRVDKLQDAYEIISAIDSSHNHPDVTNNALHKHIHDIANKCCNKDIKSIVNIYFHQIYAHLLPVIVLGSDDSKVFQREQSAKAATKFLHFFIKDLNKMVIRKSALIILELISLMVKRHMIPNFDFCSNTLLLRSIRHISDVILNHKKASSNPNLFQTISLSPIEVILQIKTIIDKAIDVKVRYHGLESLNVIIDLVLGSPSATIQSELDFVIGSLLSICSKSECDKFRTATLIVLETLFKRMLGNGTTDTDSYIPININKVVAFLIQFHQKRRTDLVNFFQTRIKVYELQKRLCLPLRPVDGDSSGVLQNVMHNRDPDIHVVGVEKMLGVGKLPESITTCVESSYDVLAIILDTGSYIFTKIKNFLDELPVITIDTPHCGILRSISEKCNLNCLLKAYEEARKLSKTRNFIDEVKLLCARCATIKKGLRDGLSVRWYSADEGVSSVSYEIRSLRQSLYQVSEELQKYILDGNVTNDVTAQLLILGKEVSALCHHELPLDIQEAITKCLGYLGLLFQFFKMEVDFSQAKTGKKHVDNPLASIYSSASRLLVTLLQGDDVDTANHAKDTVKFLVTTTDGRDAFQHSDIPPECRHILSSFRTDDATRSNDIPEVSTAFSKKTLSLVQKKHESDTSWCWADNFWRLPYEMNLTYDEWIRHIVCAMILCCYNLDGRNRNRPIKGTSMFIPGCLSMCARDYKFASIIFPAIVYDILDTDTVENFKPPEDNSSFSRNWMIGSGRSLANRTLSRCFNSILNSYNRNYQSIKTQDQKFDSFRAITIIIDALNLLRITTERRFIKTTHPRQFVSSIKGRIFNKENGVYICSEKGSNYNKVEGPPVWSGRPYGVVLNLSGIELSQAYLESHDYFSALFYAEFFADNQLGSSGNTFELLRTLEFVQNSISGFYQPNISSMEIMKDSSTNKSQLAINLHGILEKCFSELHEDDALAGLEHQICSIRFDQPQSFNSGRHHVTSNMTPSEVMVTLMQLDNAAQEQSRQTVFSDRLAISSCMTQLGLRYVSRMLMSGTRETDFSSKVDQKKFSEQWAEESWRLFQWEHFLPSKDKELNISLWLHEDDSCASNKIYDCTQTTGYHMSLKCSIHSLLENDLPNFWLNLSASRSSLIEDFNTRFRNEVQNNELCSLALKACTLNQLEDLGLVCSTNMSPDAWLGKYRSKSSIFSHLSNLTMQFDELESSMAAHEIFLKVLYIKFGDTPSDYIGSTLSNHLWGMCRLAREKKKPNVALSALRRLREFFKLEHENLTLPLKYNLEEAKITQLFGNTSTSVQFCKEIITRLTAISPTTRTNDENILLIETQLQCAQWLIEYSIESDAIILDDLLKPAAHFAWTLYDKGRVKPSLVASSNYALGSFAANLYDSVQKRVKSHAWKLLGDAARGRQRQLEDLRQIVKMKRKSNSVDYRVSEFEYIALEKEVLMDSKERESVEKSVAQYLELAIESFGRALSTSSCSFYDTKHVFQFISLWFRNCSNETDNINDKVSGWLPKIPSYHFVPLIYQIFSRVDASIDPTSNNFQSVLQNLVCSICIEHPYHGIIQLIALANGNNVVRSKKEDIFTENVQKVEAVEKILQRIRNTGSSFITGLVDSYNILVDSYIALAMLPTDKFVNKGMLKNIPFSSIREIPKHLQLPRCLRSRSQYMPCILTKPPKVRADANYGDGDTDPIGSERIQSFESSFSLTDSGIHRPKIVVCRGSSGGSFKQLVKGDDDIRQDAVMQQVFSSMNVFLRNENKEALSGRELRLITYRCVPLSPATGVLEWVENTIPIGTYLTTSATGAHDRYYPGEWGNSLCRLHMQCSPQSQKRASFDEVCKHFSPAFRFFFLENFSTPQLWHHARMTYTRSCAVSSMVGHILGIGDRHTQNILIKQSTGEIVHIDFGIVFEQGKVLPTPETVPFRLTRNIVDGMGPLGTEGVFTAAARATTKVLRDNSNAILTILAAVVSDPLYSWRVSTAKGRQVQHDTTQVGESDLRNTKLSDTNPTLSILDSDNDAATRAIARIHEKLKGYEEGTLGEQQTVESQVRFLINQARDPDKLCNLYAGWAPWV